MGKRVLITGGQGMLAFDIARIWRSAGHDVVGLSRQELDITQPEQVRAVIDQLAPDIVFNTPGISVDICESKPEEGFRIHAWAAENIASHCQRVGAVCVYISSCGMFGDTIKFYSEYDPVELKTSYARSKYKGEQGSFRQCNRLFVIRPGWLFGGERRHSRNFVYQRYLEALEKDILISASDKFGCPTFTVDLAEQLLSIVESEQYGLYHVTNSGQASRYEYVKCALESFGLSTEVRPVDSSYFERSAPVPDCELLQNLNSEFLGLRSMPDWRDAIERYVWGLKNEGAV